ncbi:MAG: extracellular solute-binding protein [Spirochaetaceae bacterium]|jgi:microcin C transport system substrate-binding protein|nr:extracellular solute-binding protein [Spirochaetaceae bacterium]GMO19888.1 MAG: extracellular solute-binding protein [Termitinemataceae bacterium]
MLVRAGFILFVFSVCGIFADENQGGIITAEYLSLRGEPALKKGWTHYPHANPNAPKGGSITQAIIGSFDNFHRYALRGNCVDGSEYFYDSLMVASLDEADVLYPLIAQKVEYPPDYSWFIWTLHPDAKNQNDEPLSAEDVAFSFNILFEKGVPQFRSAYKGVVAEALDSRRVRYTIPQKRDEEDRLMFDSRGNPVHDKDLMMGLATSPVFVKNFWAGHDFSEPLIAPPLGTGAYRVKEYAMGSYVVFERVKNYWAAGLPVNKGRNNFDTIRYDYYHDANVAFEAFKAGEYDFRRETSPKNWATGYKGKLFDSGEVVLREISFQAAQVMRGFIFNIQRPVFADRRIRKALSYFFDFEWMNKQLFYNSYTRTRSYFQWTNYEARGLPDAKEIAALAPVKNLIPPEVYTEEFNPPKTDGSGFIRNEARKALALFNEAGWKLINGKLVNEKKEQFSFELLITSVEAERIAIVFARNLERYGIEMRIRNIDSSQFLNRLRSRDFDMIANGYPPIQTPSSDLMIIWNSKYIESTWNTPGVSDAAIDYLTRTIADSQEDGEKLLSLGRAFDRVLCWNYFMIPQWTMPYRIAYNRKFVNSGRFPKLAMDINAWWVEP